MTMDLADLEHYLEPISDSSPCGENLEYDLDFGELERTNQYKPEQQIGTLIVAAESPDWKKVRQLATKLLSRTKDLRVAMALATSSVPLEGFPGFECSTKLIRGYVEKYWDGIYPELDTDDNNDPAYRVNTLSMLCDEDAFLKPLRDVPLVESTLSGKITYRQIEAALQHEGNDGKDSKSKSDAAEALTMTVIRGAFAEVPIEQLTQRAEALDSIQQNLNAIEEAVTNKVGASKSLSLDPIVRVIVDMHRTVVGHLESRKDYKPADAEPPGGSTESHSLQPTDGQVNSAAQPLVYKFDGKIRTREEAILALDGVCAYYAENEPSSPLPMLIRRAKRLASKSFIEILQDLLPDSVDRAQSLRGPEQGGESG
jgi:type VI secretion system protein ImpA